MNDNEKELLIKEAIRTKTGRALLAASMVNPLRTNSNYRDDLPDFWIANILAGFSEDTVQIKEYLVSYIRKYKNFDSLRRAVVEACPEHEIMLDKLLVLR